MRALILTLATLVAAPAQSQTAPRLDAKTAQAIVNGCAADAAGKRQSHAIAVVDIGGHVIAALRMDHTSSGMMDFALAKAEAVAAWGFPTADMAEAAKGTPGCNGCWRSNRRPGGPCCVPRRCSWRRSSPLKAATSRRTPCRSIFDNISRLASERF